jgi:hypothetical protein
MKGFSLENAKKLNIKLTNIKYFNTCQKLRCCFLQYSSPLFQLCILLNAEHDHWSCSNGWGHSGGICSKWGYLALNWDIELELCYSMSRYMLCKTFMLDLLLNAYVFMFYNIICCLLQLRIDVLDLQNILDLVLGSLGYLQV